MMAELYPDLGRRGDRPPSLLQAEALAWVSAAPVIWMPPMAVERDPVALLAIIGAMSLSAALSRPCGWDGESLRGQIDLVSALAEAQCAVAASSDDVVIYLDDRPWPMAPDRSKYWSGKVTLVSLWERARGVIREWAYARNKALLDDDDPGPPRVALDRRAEVRISATGYDAAIVSVPIRDGFAASRHDNITIVGGRPILELLALFGAQRLEQSGRWPKPWSPRFPILTGQVLRDVLDLDRLLMLQPGGAAITPRSSGKRSYLDAP